MALGYPTTGTPGAPTSLTATAGNAEVDLSWSTPASDGGSAITGYKIYRDTASPATTLVDTIGVTTSYNDTGRTVGVEYFYRVKATNALGDSAFSNEDSATPLAKTVVFLTSTSASNQTWNVLSDWNSADNLVEVIASGASGGVSWGTGNRQGTGGGAGAFSSEPNISLTPSGTATYRLPAGGTGVSRTSTGNTNGNAGADAWFNGITLAGSSVGAKGGVNGLGGNGGGALGGGAGGAAASGIGTTKTSGGRGGDLSGASTSRRATGGGGAGGPSASGSNGGDTSSNFGGTSGGNGGGPNGGSGSSDAANSNAGGAGTHWQASPARGTGGGSGAGVNASLGAATSGNGGSFGGGSGGAVGTSGTVSSGAGGPALIVITNNASL